MADLEYKGENEKEQYETTVLPVLGEDGKETSNDEKFIPNGSDGEYRDNADVEEQVIGNDLKAVGNDIEEAEEQARLMSMEEVRDILTQVLALHREDPNFPIAIIDKIDEFLSNEDVLNNPDHHAELVHEMKVEAAMITNNSPYAEVRAVVDNFDDPTLHSSTLRAWIIGIVYVGIGAFINQFFSVRNPAISVNSTCAQLLAYPAGKAFEKFLPDWGFTAFGQRFTLNPGAFNKKEHMLITIMANVGFNTPYTDNIIWSQFLPVYFNQSYAGEFSYQILIALGTNFVGYGVAGLTRKFLVYPAYCVWPTSLVTIALNKSFHSEANIPVPGPFGRIYRASRLKCFTICFVGMFVYFWFPDYIFLAMSTFNWPTWIAPQNTKLALITGFFGGLGINPLPSFDWNYASFQTEPLVVPLFNTMNLALGMLISTPVLIALYWTNAWNTAYLPINSNHLFDNTGGRYNITKILNDHGEYDQAMYEVYSPAFLAAGNLVVYLFFFAVYAATFSYTILYHRHEIWIGFKNVFGRKNKGMYLDVHNRLQAAYPEVPEWWYAIALCFAIACACAGISGWETYTSPGVVFFGLAMCLICVIPIGIIYAITGNQVTLNVLAEFIGGSWAPGNALSMMYFKSFGYVTCAQTLAFANDLKLAHYTHIPPRHTFWAQMVGTLVSSFVCTAILNFQMGLDGVCTPNAPNKFTCPGINTFFTAAALFGTLGPIKEFGKGGQYTLLLLGFPIGFVVPFFVWYARKKFPSQSWLRQIHPVVLFTGGLLWAPYNWSYLIPSIYPALYSMGYLRRKYLAFWSKYNYVVSAAFATGIAIGGTVIFFALDYPEVELNWWGNYIIYGGVNEDGCDANSCVLRPVLPDAGYFGPAIGDFH